MTAESSGKAKIQGGQWKSQMTAWRNPFLCSTERFLFEWAFLWLLASGPDYAPWVQQKYLHLSAGDSIPDIEREPLRPLEIFTFPGWSFLILSGSYLWNILMYPLHLTRDLWSSIQSCSAHTCSHVDSLHIRYHHLSLQPFNSLLLPCDWRRDCLLWSALNPTYFFSLIFWTWTCLTHTKHAMLSALLYFLKIILKVFSPIFFSISKPLCMFFF